MTTKFAAVFGVLVALTGCGGALEEASSGAQAVEGASLAARPSTADFATIAVGTSATRSVTLTNTGRAPVDVVSVTYSADFPPDPCRAVVLQPCIRPGESTTLTVTCSPTTAGSLAGRVAVAYHTGDSTLTLSVPVTGDAATRR
jgi:trimeric autotransporter adhesin